MNKYDVTKKIEKFAPPELAEDWDCSGWGIETGKTEVNKIMLCLTVTDDIVKQAEELNCDMIISHHPLFYVPVSWKKFDIYSAHTNLDRADGGTTDTLVSELGLRINEKDDFLRYADVHTNIEDFCKKLSEISPNLRYVNNKNIRSLKKVAFCAGSGSEFINEAYENGADALVTGDIKFHTALESPIVLFDIGHFESEILVMKVFEKLLSGLDGLEIVRALEKSPFNHFRENNY